MITRVCLSVLVSLFCFVLPVGAWADVSDQGDSLLSESPNGEREHRLHQKALAELDKGYQSRIDQVQQVYEQAVSAHIDRYITHMDHIVRRLTRSDKLDQAAELNNLLFDAKQWAVTPPDHEGKHFLSGKNLAAGVNETADLRGGELMKLVNLSAEKFIAQRDEVDQWYVDQGTSARRDYVKALERVLSIEQRGARLDAYRQVQAEITRVSGLPPVERPSAPQTPQAEQDEPIGEIDLFPDVPGTRSAPKDFRGYFMVQYKKSNGQLKFSYLLELSEKAGNLHAASWARDNGKWDSRQRSIKIIERGPDRIVYQHGTQGGEAVYHRLTLEDGKPVKDEMWWGEKAFRNNAQAHEHGEAQPLGTSVNDLQHADGEFYVDVHSTMRPDGRPHNRKGKFRMQVRDGVIIMTGAKWDRLNAPWQPMVPRVMQAQPVEGGHLLRYDERTRPFDHVFMLEMPDDALPSIKIWWQSGLHSRGEQASATGRPNGAYLIELANLYR